MVQGRKPVQKIVDWEPPSPVASDGGDTASEEEPQGISLEDLGNAFAEVLKMSPAQVANEHEPAEHRSSDRDLPHGSSDLLLAPANLTPASILESILFVGTRTSEPIGMRALLQHMRDFSEEEIHALVHQLNELYRAQGHAFEIAPVGEGYAMRLASGLEEIQAAWATTSRESQLSQNAIDCLALIAYQPGVDKEQIEHQWGQPAGSVLSYLIRKGLIRVEDARYFTTERFLEILGLDSLEDLPRGDEL